MSHERMSHEEAATLLTDYAADRLSYERAESVKTHLASCDDCSEVLATVRGLRVEIREHGAALIEPHPDADVLARYASTPDALAIGELERVGSHVRACATCRHEVDVAHRAASRSAAWWYRLGELLSPRTPAPAWAPAVLTALVLLLAYPAYLGIKSGTEDRSASGPGGGARVLLLEVSTRGVAGEIPAFTLPPEQATVPVIIAVDLPGGGEMSRAITVRLVRDESSIWSREMRASEIWDDRLQAVTLLIPRDRLSRGEQRLEVIEPGGATYRLPFRVEASPP